MTKYGEALLFASEGSRDLLVHVNAPGTLTLDPCGNDEVILSEKEARSLFEYLASFLGMELETEG